MLECLHLLVGFLLLVLIIVIIMNGRVPTAFPQEWSLETLAQPFLEVKVA